MQEAPSNTMTLRLLVEQEVKDFLRKEHSCRSYQITVTCDLFNPVFTGTVCGIVFEGSYRLTNGRLILKVWSFVKMIIE